MRSLILLLLLSFFLVGSGWAVDPNLRISQYGHSVWRMPDGSVHPWLVTQTPDGYILLKTLSGLTRFDGVRFTPWIPPNCPTLPKGFQGLLTTRDGSLWIASTAGLFRSKGNQWFDYSSQIGSTGIGGILEDHSGTIWFTRYRVRDGKGPFCRVKNDVVDCYGKKDGIPVNYALAVAEDSQANIWFGSYLLCRHSPDGSNSCFDPKHKGQLEIADMAAGPTGRVWVALDRVGPGLGLNYLSRGTLAGFQAPGFDGSKVRASKLFLDRNHSLWIGTDDKGLYRIHDGVADHYGSAEGLSGNMIYDMFEDRDGNFWVATNKGLDFFRDTPVVSFSTDQGLSYRPKAVVARRDGSVWVSNLDSLDVIRGDTVLSLTSGHGLPGEDPVAILEDRSGRLWAGVDHRLMIYERGRFSDVRGLDGKPLQATGPAEALTEADDGGIWALINGAETGLPRHLFYIKKDRVEKDILVDNLFPASTFLAAGRDGEVWLTATREEIGHYHDGRVDKIPLSKGQTNPRLFGISVDSENSVWVPSSDGLYRWKDGKLNLMNSSNGLGCSAIYGMIKDNSGDIWLFGDCGLLKISASDWTAWLNAPQTKVSPKTFDSFDGVLTVPGIVLQPRASKAPDGRLWFASDPIVQVIDPSHLHQNATPPPVLIEGLIADRKAYAPASNLRLPPKTRDLEIDYTALSYAVPQKVQFRYKLEGRDRDWQDPGTRRQAFYTDLRPGNYKFRVRASNNDGVWNEAGAEAGFILLPAWYQTFWFWLTCAAGFLMLLWALYQLRLQQLARQFQVGMEERVNERLRIGRELHDTLLQSLHGLMFRFQAARNMLPGRPDEALQALDGAISRTEQAIAESRDAIKNLRSEPVARGNLAELVAAAGQDLVAQDESISVPTFQALVEGEPRKLAPIVQDELYRIVRELLRNAFGHAAAHHIEAEIRYDDKLLRVRLRDDGKGIDPKVLREGGRAGHWGLRGVRERAHQLGAKLDIWSEVGRGTEVQIDVPAAIAYEIAEKVRSWPFRLTKIS